MQLRCRSFAAVDRAPLEPAGRLLRWACASHL
jgi:hypothetical protein